jgi:HEAT repeat protein
MPMVGHQPSEVRRRELFEQLRALGEQGVQALARGLTDPDVMLRRNVLLALYAIGHGHSDRGYVAKVDIGSSIPALVKCFKDPDGLVRAWSLQALTGIEPLPISVKPEIVALLGDPSAGVRLSACAAVGKYGPAAADSRAAVQALTRDQHADVQRCASYVLGKIAVRP